MGRGGGILLGFVSDDLQLSLFRVKGLRLAGPAVLGEAPQFLQRKAVDGCVIEDIGVLQVGWKGFLLSCCQHLGTGEHKNVSQDLGTLAARG